MISFFKNWMLRVNLMQYNRHLCYVPQLQSCSQWKSVLPPHEGPWMGRLMLAVRGQKRDPLTFPPGYLRILLPLSHPHTAAADHPWRTSFTKNFILQSSLAKKWRPSKNPGVLDSYRGKLSLLRGKFSRSLEIIREDYFGKFISLSVSLTFYVLFGRGISR